MLIGFRLIVVALISIAIVFVATGVQITQDMGPYNITFNASSDFKITNVYDPYKYEGHDGISYTKYSVQLENESNMPWERGASEILKTFQVESKSPNE